MVVNMLYTSLPRGRNSPICPSDSEAFASELPEIIDQMRKGKRKSVKLNIHYICLLLIYITYVIDSALWGLCITWFLHYMDR